MKCWNPAFSAQSSRIIIVAVQVGAVKIYVAAVEALRKKERGDETQFTTKNILVEKLVCVPVLQNFSPSYAFDAPLGRNWPFSPPTRWLYG
jgi:hypothetical protein